MRGFEPAGLHPLWCGPRGGRQHREIGRPDGHVPADYSLPAQAQPRAVGVAHCRRGDGGERAGASASAGATAERAARRRTAARRTKPRGGAAALARGLRDRAHRLHSRRYARLHRHRGNLLAVRSNRRALGRGLLHGLCRQERRGGEPSRHLCIQRRTGRGIGLSQSRLGRPADPRIARQRSRRRAHAGQSRDLACLHRSGHDRSGRLRLEQAGQARRRQRVLWGETGRAGGGEGHRALSRQERP